MSQFYARYRKLDSDIGRLKAKSHQEGIKTTCRMGGNI